jgi:uncharacterized Fe-S cluster protein YjdI/CDGSH-type Zn-finger protein
VPKRLQVYEAEAVTVTFDPNLCRHAEECVRGLPAVFDPTARRWIRPERAPAAEVRAVVARCPSGALRALPSEPETGPAAVTVRVSEDGPLLLRGRIRLERSDGALLAELEAASLCRCGATANPPFCDGSHERLAGHRG